MSLLPLFNFIFQFLISSSAVLILIQIVRCIIIPKMILKTYNKQDVQTQFFFFFLGAVTRERAYKKTHKDILGYYKQLAKDTPDLSALIYNFGSRIDVSLLDPKLIKEFYRKESLYQKGFTTKAIKTLTGTGLFVAEGDLWKSHRKIISSMFHYDFLERNVPVIISTARELFHKISRGPLQQVNIADEIQRITGEVVGKIFFSEKLNDYQFKEQSLTMYLTEMLTRLPTIFRDPKIWFLVMTGLDLNLASSYRKFSKDMKEFRHFCLKIIQKHKVTHSKDLIGNLLETQSKKAQNPHESFSDEDIISEFLTFFIAGMDTTGQLVTMILLLLLHLNPQYIQDIEKEITDIYEKENLPSLETINKMTGIHGIIKETLRLYDFAPKIPAREALVDHKLGNLNQERNVCKASSNL